MVEKLNDMIKDRYGKGFSIRQLAGVLDSGNDSVLKGKDLYIPIQVKDVFLGYGLVHEAQDLPTETHAHLTRLVRMVLEPTLYSQHLERTLHNMEIEKTEGTSINEMVDADEIEKPKCIFVFGQHQTRVQKISIEIHEISENWSYLPFQDVEKRMEKVSDFAELENTTLVVDLERGFSKEKQKLISNYMESSRKGALLMFVSSKPSYQLLEAGLIDERLHEHLKKCEFSVDRLPIEKNTMKDVLEMLYFQT